MPAVTHLLKVLNGPHTGAQIGFGEGESLLIGNSPEADIILSDPHILPQHCSVRVSGKECTVVPLDGEVFVSGIPVTAPEPTDAGRVVTIGSTSFVVGEQGGDWPALVIPDQKNVGRSAGHDDSASTNPDEKNRPHSGSPLRIFLICLVGLSIIIFAASVFTANGYRKTAHTEYPGTVEEQIEDHTDLRAGDALEELEKTFHRDMPDLQTFRTTNSPHGSLVVLAPDEDTALKARQLAGTARKAVYVDVVNLSEVNAVLLEISHMRAPQVSAVLQPDGTLLWKGYLRSRSEFPKLKQEERQDLPFLGKDDDQIGYGETLAPQFSSILSSFGVSAGITVKPEEAGVVLSGDISPDKSARLKEALEKISSLHPDVHLENKVGSSSGGTEIESMLGGRVAGVTFGKSAWIELTNGTRLFPGTRLGNGMLLLGINPREISFQTPGGVMKMSVEAVTAQPPPISKH